MSQFIINVTNTSSETGSISPDVGFDYTDMLNDVNESTISISGLGSVKRGLLEMGSKVEIIRDGNREFYGLVDETKKLKGGAITFHISGYEIWLAKEPGVYANSPYKSVASATIAANIIGESTKFTAGTIEAGSNIDFRINTSDKLYNALSNLVRKTQQDIGIDYVNFEIDVLDHKGSSTSVATFNEGIQISDVGFSEGYPKGTVVNVFGKGDGEDQITGTATDAGAVAQFGNIPWNITDRTVMSSSEADTLATAELAISKLPTKIYDFDVLNPNISLVSGDHLTLNSEDQDLNNEEVRTVGIRRGERGKEEFLQLQVANPETKRTVLNRNRILADIQKLQRDADTYMQGSGNTLTWARGLNAKSTVDWVLPFNVPAAFIEDEAGNLRVDSFTLDYDVDPYKKGVGGATYDGSDPQVQNNSANTQPGVAGSSASTTLVTIEGTDSFSENVSTSWDLVMSEAVSGTFGFLYFYVQVNADFSGTDDLHLRIRSGTTDHIVDYYLMNTGVDSNLRKVYMIPILGSVSTTFEVYLASSGGQNYNGSLTVYEEPQGHTHADGTYTADNHLHTDGTYDILAADIDDITVGDDISDAGSINATDVAINVDFWNGSTWVNKLTIASTGLTLENDVDLTDGGTLPDAAGLWRTRITPNNASPDYVQGIIKIKHSLDS